jgi:gas vesicle protein
MEDNNSSYSKGFLIGAVVGGAVGAVVALLFAPKSGRELRRDIADRTEEVVDKAQQMFNKATGAGQTASGGFDDVVNEGRIAAERIVSTARHQADNLMSNAEQVLRDAKNRASRVSDASKAGDDAFRSEFQ